MTEHLTTAPPTAAAPAATEDTEARDRSIITVLLIATFVVILNETIMNVALPRLSEEFNVAASVVQWLATAFMLTMAVVIPATGFLMQRLTTRTVFFAAMGIFGLGTLLAGFAPNFEILLLARVAQAIGTAIMTPLLFTTVLTLVPASRRGAVMGTITIVIAVAPALGPTVGGAILQYLSWRYLFFFVLPIVLAVTAYGARTLVNYSEPQRVSLDLPSLPLAALGFGGLVYSLSSLGESHAGLGDPLVGGSLLVSLVSLGLFVWRQIFLQRHGTPLLDFRVLRYPIYTLGLTVLALLALVLFGSGILLPMYVQQVRGLDPLQTGLLMLPGGLLMGLLSPSIGRMSDRSGPKALATAGGLMLTRALWGLSRITAETGVPHILSLHIVMSLAMAMIFTPVFSATSSPLPSRFYGHGSALISTLQQVAGAAGTALLVTVMTSRAAQAATEMVPPLAQAEGIRAAFLVAAGVSLLVTLLAPFLRNGTPPEGEAEGERIAMGH